jgi:predicted SAM-dependent methyltransferase
MKAEFTGERVIPGQVDVDLWNEHYSRYAFARRLARGKRVLDAGCGGGYGAADLAVVARSVTALDVAEEALSFAGANYSEPRYVQGSCTRLPFAAGSFDLVVMYEVIEHLVEWREALGEARRVLAPDGQFIVSTPNKGFYAETRAESGPNPFHEHEFEYTEFCDALREVFPYISMYLQDHSECVLVRSAGNGASAEGRILRTDASPEESSFFIAVCGSVPDAAASSFVFVPRSSNLLREKLQHIRQLEDEVQTKDRWIAQQQADHQELLRRHAEQLAELEKSNRWAEQTGAELDTARTFIAALQKELGEAHEAFGVFEKQIEELTAELEARTRWAEETERRLTADLSACAADRDHQTGELGKCVEMLHQTESTLEERTRWALSLNEEKARLESAMGAVRASRWMRLGRVIGLGPELQSL